MRALFHKAGRETWRTIGAIAIVISFSGEALASAESAQLVEIGQARLESGNVSGALAAFESAAEADPLDAPAWYWQGVAFLRAAKFPDALAMFAVAESLGYQGADLKLERAKALVQIYDYEGAARDLRDYLKTNPNSAQARLLLGKCLLATGEPAAAGAQLSKAASLNPSYASTAESYRAQADPLEALMTTGPVFDGKSGPVKTVAEPEKPKNWWLSFSTSVGWNSNVVALGQGIELPPGMFRKGAAFVELNLDTGYTFRLTDSTRLTLGYYLDQTFYESIPEANLMVNYWYATLSQRLDDRFSLLLTISDEFDAVGGLAFRNKTAVNPALYAHWNSWTSTLLDYTWSYSAYYFDLPDVFDRTGNHHRITLDQSFRIPSLASRFVVGYFHEFNLSQGSDFDYNADGIRVALETEFPWKIRLDAGYEHVFYYYSNNNSLTGFTTRRNDGTDVVRVLLSRPIQKWLTAYLRYDMTNNASNISYYSFDQHIIAAGLRLDL